MKTPGRPPGRPKDDCTPSGGLAKPGLGATILRLASAGLIAATLAVLPAWADVSRDQAAAAAQSQSGGRVLSVDRTEAGRRPVWRVKVVTPRGEVRVILIDAATGRAV